MKVHPYRDIIDPNEFRCSKQRKHFSGAGNVRCVLQYYHSGYCQWPDQYPNNEDNFWIPCKEDRVRVSYPIKSTKKYLGTFGVVKNSPEKYSINHTWNIWLINSVGVELFVFLYEIELIANKYMKG